MIIKPELDQTKRLKKVKITRELLGRLLSADGYIFKTTSQIPKYADVVSVVVDNNKDEINVIFYHESFEELLQDEQIPYFEHDTFFETIKAGE